MAPAVMYVNLQRVVGEGCSRVQSGWSLAGEKSGKRQEKRRRYTICYCHACNVHAYLSLDIEVAVWRLGLVVELRGDDTGEGGRKDNLHVSTRGGMG